MAASVVYTNFGGQVVSENRGGVKRDYVSDTLGSTIALMDSNGTVTDTWEYWPYGEVSSRTGTNPTPFTFVGTLGYFRDLVSKLTYVRARFYQAITGQWMTMDPLWPDQDAYAYALSAPSVHVDPSGLCCPFVIWPGSALDGWVRVNCNCSKYIRVAIIREGGGPPITDVECCEWYRADGFYINGIAYKISGATCVTIDCSVCPPQVMTCQRIVPAWLGRRGGNKVGPPREIEDPGKEWGKDKVLPPGTVPPIMK